MGSAANSGTHDLLKSRNYTKEWPKIYGARLFITWFLSLHDFELQSGCSPSFRIFEHFRIGKSLNFRVSVYLMEVWKLWGKHWGQDNFKFIFVEQLEKLGTKTFNVLNQRKILFLFWGCFIFTFRTYRSFLQVLVNCSICKHYT